MNNFRTTALEEANKKVYIVSNINNSNKKVLNMILKFIEDPINNTYAIFMSDNDTSLLPTIVSRCQKIRFKQRDFSFLIEDYKKNGFSEDDAYILSCIKHSVDKDVIENNEAYNNAKNIAYELIDNLKKKEYIPILLGIDFDNSLDKKEDIELVMKLHVFCKLHNMKYCIKYVPDAVCWSQAPEKLKDLIKQRRRWHIGLFQSM